MSIYPKPTKILMKEFVGQNIKPGQAFEKKQAVDWFGQKYPNIKPNTVQMHVEGMAVNSNSRKHHPSIKPGSDHDLFYKLGPSQFRLWEPSTDPQPIYRDSGAASTSTLVEPSDEQADTKVPLESSEEFAFERDLRKLPIEKLNVYRTRPQIVSRRGIFWN
jgi:hypothetical protein